MYANSSSIENTREAVDAAIQQVKNNEPYDEISPEAQAIIDGLEELLKKLQEEEAYIGEDGRRKSKAERASDFAGEDATEEQKKKKLHELNADDRQNKSQTLNATQKYTSSMRQEADEQLSSEVSQELFETEKELLEVREESAKKTEEIEQATKNTSKVMNQPKKMSWSDSFVKVAQSVTAAYSAIQMFNGAMETLLDPDISVWEKFGTVFTTLAMVIPMVSSAIGAMKTVLGEDTVATITNTLAKILKTKASKDSAKASKDEAKASRDSAAANYEEAASEVVEEGVDRATSNSGKSGGKAAGKSGGKAAGKAGGTAAKGGASGGAGGTATSGAGGASGTASLGSMIGGAALVAAGILLIVGAIALSVELYNKEAKAAKKAAEQAERAAERADELKQKYQETQSTIDSYEDGRKKLEELTKGTLEWKEALADTNEEAKKLIAQFGEELKGKYEIIDGQIVFDEGVLEELEEAQLDKRNKASAVADLAKIEAIKKQNEAEETKMARDKLSSLQDWNVAIGNTIASTAVGAAGGSLIGGGVGLMGGPWGAAAGFGVGAAIGAGVGLTTGIGASIAAGASGSEEEILEKIAKEYESNSTLFDGTKDEFAEIMQQKIGLEDATLIDSLWSNKDAVEELTKTLAVSNAEILALRTSAVTEMNQGKDGFNDIIAAYAASENQDNNLQGRTEAGRDKAWDLLHEGNGWIPWEKNDVLQKEYIEKIYGGKADYEGEGGYRFQNDWGKSGQLQQWDEATKKWVDVGDWEWDYAEIMVQQLSDYYANDLSAEDIKSFGVKTDAEIDKLTKYGLSSEEAKSVVKDWAGTGQWDFSELSRNEIKRIEMYGTEEQKAAAESAQTAWENTLDNYLGSTQKILNGQSGVWLNFSKAMTTAYANQLDQITQLGGDSQAFNNSIDALLKNNAGQEEKILNLLNSADFSKGQEGLNQFLAGLYEAGIEIPQSTLTSLKLAVDALPLQRVNEDLATMQENLKGVSSLVSGLSFGDIISDEEYDRLVKYNAALRDMFVYTADGYRWIGSLSDKNEATEAVNSYAESYLNTNKNKQTIANKTKDLSKKDSWGGLVTRQSKTAALQDLVKTLSDDELSTLGTSSQAIKEILSLEDDSAFNSYADTILSNMQTLWSENDSGEYGRKGYEMVASLYSDLESLDAAYQQGLLGSTKTMADEVYNTQKEYLEKTSREVKKAVNEFSLEKIEWELDQIEDKAGNAATKIAKIGEKAALREDALTFATDDLDELLAAKNVSSLQELDLQTLSESELAIVEAYQSAYQNYIDGLRSDQEEMLEQLKVYFTDITSEFDKSTKSVAKLTTMTNHYRNTINLLGKGLTNIGKEFEASLIATEAEAYRQQTATAQQTLSGLTARRAELEKEYNALLASGKLDGKAQAQWEEAFNEIDSEIEKVSNNLQDSMTKGLQAAADTFQLQVEDIFEKFEDDLAGSYKSLEELSEAFDQQADLSSQYVSDYEKIYKLSKLTRQIENSMNNSNSVKAKATLAALQNEITAAQASGKQLSEYDLEYMEKKYQLRLAEIALEESQAAKKSVRLARGADGGWSYVYTQNTDEMEKTAQEYEDKLYELQDFQNSSLSATASSIISIQTQFSNAMRDIYNDNSLSDAERVAKINEITDYYSQKLEFATGQYDTMINHNKLLYEEDWTNYSLSTGYKISANENFAISFNTSVLGTLMEGTQSAQAIFNEFTSAIGTPTSSDDSLLGSLNKAYDSYVAVVNNIVNASGFAVSIDGYKASITTALWGENGSKDNPTSGSLLGEVNSATQQIQTWLSSIFTTKIDGEVTVFDSIVGKIKKWVQDNLINGDVVLPDSPTGEIPTTTTTDTTTTDTTDTATVSSTDTTSNTTTTSSTDTTTTSNTSTTSSTDTTTTSSIDTTTSNTSTTSSTGGVSQGTTHTGLSRQDRKKNNQIIQTYGDASEGGNEDELLAGTLYSSKGISQKHYILNELAEKDNKGNGGWFDPVKNTGKFVVHLPEEGSFLMTLNSQSQAEALRAAGYDIIIKNGYSPSAGAYRLGDEVQVLPDKVSKHSSGYLSTIYNGAGANIAGETSSVHIDQLPGVITGLITIKHPPTRYDPAGGPDTTIISTGVMGTQRGGYQSSLYFPVEWFVPAFDTGGYTGSWGPEGRLAMLHQKEIVLNADDTKNLLSAVDLVRTIASTIDLQAQSQAFALSMRAAMIAPEDQVLQQQVTIRADFPNATNHSEIEQAFDTLINRATQYANRF